MGLCIHNAWERCEYIDHHDPANYPGLRDLRSAKQLFRIWFAPSFQSQTSWTLFDDAGSYWCRRVAECPTLLGRRLRPAPDTYGAEGQIPMEDALRLCQAARELAAQELKPSRPEGILLDGDTFGCEFREIDGETLWWYGSPSADLKPVEAWWFDVRSVFEVHLPELTKPRY